MEKIQAPFTDAQVTQLNRYQEAGLFHPFNCQNGHKLQAFNEGWKCPYCVWYSQDWAWAFMANRKFLDAAIDHANT